MKIFSDHFGGWPVAFGGTGLTAVSVVFTKCCAQAEEESLQESCASKISAGRWALLGYDLFLGTCVCVFVPDKTNENHKNLPKGGKIWLARIREVSFDELVRIIHCFTARGEKLEQKVSFCLSGEPPYPLNQEVYFLAHLQVCILESIMQSSNRSSLR